MGRTTDLRRELKRRFLPLLTNAGFELDESNAPQLLRLRRIDTKEAQILEIQWDKYGRPRFVLNFARCPSSGVQLRERHFAVDAAVFAGRMKSGGRLQPRRGAGARSWFRQDKPLIARLFSREKLYSVDAIVDEALRLYPQIEAYWRDGQIGPHLRMHIQGV